MPFSLLPHTHGSHDSSPLHIRSHVLNNLNHDERAPAVASTTNSHVEPSRSVNEEFTYDDRSGKVEFVPLRQEYDTTIKELLMKISAQVNADKDKRSKVIEQQTATKKEIATLEKASIALEFECDSLTAQIRRNESLLEDIKYHSKGPVPDAGMGTTTTVAEDVTITLTLTDIGEDAAAGDDLGQNSFTPLQGFRGELIAKAGGLLAKDDKDIACSGVSQAPDKTSTGDGRIGRDRQGVQQASDHRIEQRSLHG